MGASVVSERVKFPICKKKKKGNQSVRQNRKGGGLAVIFSSKVICNDIDLGEFTTYEYLDFWELKGELVLIIIIVSADKTSFSIFGITKFDQIILSVDLKIHIIKENDSKAMELMSLLDSFALNQCSHTSAW